MDDWIRKFGSKQFFQKKTQENNKFEFYTDLVDEFSFTELKNQPEKVPDISKFSPEHRQDQKNRSTYY